MSKTDILEKIEDIYSDSKLSDIEVLNRLLKRKEEEEEAKNTMHRLNNAITETDGLGAAYMIGPSYFLNLSKNGGDFDKLWDNHLKGLLYEYLRGNRDADEQMKRLENAYKGIAES